MKKYYFSLLIVAAAFGILSCDKDDDSAAKSTDAERVSAAVDACLQLKTLFGQIENMADDGKSDATYKAILEKYVNTTVVPTYRALAEAALEMREANENLRDNPSDATIKAASDAWMNARIWWEMSEAFLFGPVGEEALDIDGHIDSWPLELGTIQSEITKGANIAGAEAWAKEPEVIGFHVTEYLLYRDGASRPVADVTPAELNYLTAATEAMVWDCVLAYVAWVGEENVPAEMRTVFNENAAVVAHLNNNPNFKDFASKLINGTNYSSMWDALSEIPAGAATIAEEVGTTKIEAPFVEKAVEKVESWYSWHSLDDYQNNIRSIKNAWLGGVSNSTRADVSLYTFIKGKDAALASQINSQIEDCLDKIAAIGEGGRSFYEVVRDNQ